MPERPDYMPRWMANWRSLPAYVVIFWFTVMTLIGIALIVWGASGGPTWALVVGAVATVVIGGQAVVFVPRGVRALRSGRSGGFVYAWPAWSPPVGGLLLSAAFLLAGLATEASWCLVVGGVWLLIAIVLAWRALARGRSSA